jgi:hypothetical protein
MEARAKRIAVVQGADTPVIQALFDAFAARNSPPLRIAGLVERKTDHVVGCRPTELRSLSGERSFALFQDLGPASTACSLDASGVIEAGERVCAEIAAGCDLVVLSKFGKLEAENRSGLIPAFTAAIAAGIPILTSVSPKYQQAWDAFAAPLYVALPPEMCAIEEWWRKVHGECEQRA